MIKFLIMTRGRTGSSAIIDTLNNVEGIRSAAVEPFLRFDFATLVKNKEPEILEQIQIMTPFELWKTQTLWRYVLGEKKLTVNYLKINEVTNCKRGIRAFGFKLLSQHLKENFFLKDILLERGYRVVYLKRSIPRQVISGMIAKQRGIYNTKTDYQDHRRYTIDIDEFKNLIEWETQEVQNDIDLLIATGFNFIQVSYEDFIRNRQTFFKHVLDFLGVSAALYPISSYSVMIKNLKHTIDNYQEVLDYLLSMNMSSADIV